MVHNLARQEFLFALIRVHSWVSKQIVCRVTCQYCFNQ